MRKILASLTVVVSLAAAPSPADAAPATSGAIQSPVCHEDERCWNWATMGSRSRGIVTKNGTPLVVSPCRFKHLMNSGMIDYRTSDVMRGDRTAMTRKCSGVGTRRPHPTRYAR